MQELAMTQNLIVKSLIHSVSAAAVTLMVAGCSGMVAPTNSGTGGGTSPLAETNDATGTKKAGADYPPEVADTVVAPITAKPTANLGKFSETSGDAIKAVSGYAMYMDMGMLKSLTITVSDGAVSENQFKKIASWECKACAGADDPMCKTQDTTAAKVPKSYSVSFTKPFMPSDTAAASENGWPLKAKTDLTETPEPTVSATISNPDAPTAMPVKGIGSIDFGSAIPAKVGDKFTAIIDMDFGGKKHKTKLESVVVTMGTPVAPPADCTLANKKYPVPKYE